MYSQHQYQACPAGITRPHGAPPAPGHCQVHDHGPSRHRKRVLLPLSLPRDKMIEGLPLSIHLSQARGPRYHFSSSVVSSPLSRQGIDSGYYDFTFHRSNHWNSSQSNGFLKTVNGTIRHIITDRKPSLPKKSNKVYHSIQVTDQPLRVLIVPSQDILSHSWLRAV